MIRALLVGLASIAAPLAARAACANYTDGSLDAPAPRAEICYDGICEATTLNVECGNVKGALLEYSNGWRFDLSDSGTSAHLRGAPKDFSLVRCAETDEGACGFILTEER